MELSQSHLKLDELVTSLSIELQDHPVVLKDFGRRHILRLDGRDPRLLLQEAGIGQNVCELRRGSASIRKAVRAGPFHSPSPAILVRRSRRSPCRQCRRCSLKRRQRTISILRHEDGAEAASSNNPRGRIRFAIKSLSGYRTVLETYLGRWPRLDLADDWMA